MTWITKGNLKNISWLRKNYPKIKYSKNYLEILNDKSIDIIVIATPISTHYQLILKALNSGKHVFVEKPLSNQYDQANYLKSIGEEYSNNKLKNLMTMANKTIFRKKNKGSGNGWHRDSINIQYKSILYLNDVNADNGAFQIIENSKSKNEILKFLILNNLDPSKTSFSENLIKKNLKDKKLKLKTLIGKKGTLILVDTSCIHRGSPLKTGIRYAITNYYYPKNLINKYDKQFSKRIKKII